MTARTTRAPAGAMTTTIETGALARALRALKLSGMLETIDARLAQARAGELGHIEFLQVLCEDEISRRQAMSIHRRLRRARFEEQATLEGLKQCSRHPAGTTSQQRSTLPVTGRDTIFQQGSRPWSAQCSPAGGHQVPSLPDGRLAKTH